METIIENLKKEVKDYRDYNVSQRQETHLKFNSEKSSEAEHRNSNQRKDTYDDEWEEEEIEMSLDKADKLIQEFNQSRIQ